VAQFGVAGNRRAAGTQFQDLQERAAAAASGANGGSGAGGLDDMASLLGDAFNDPEMLATYEKAMEELSKMSPEELQAQMSAAMSQLADGSMMDEILKQKDEVIANLEATQAVTPEELARYKTDDAYFELKMRESFGQMQELFNDPQYLKAASDTMTNVASLMNDPSKVFEGIAALSESLTDEDIETARLQLLRGDFADDPMLQKAFETEDMRTVLQDSHQFKVAVKEGYQNMLKDEL